LIGQVSYPFSMFEAAFTFLIVIGVVYGSQAYTEDFMRQETADAQADRIKNAALALDSIPEGHIEIPIQDYEYKLNGDEITVKFREEEQSVRLNDVNAGVTGESDFTELSGLCIEKTQTEEEPIIEFNSGAC